MPTSGAALLSRSQLDEIIRVQTGMIKLGIDFDAVIALVARETQLLTGAEGAAVELAEGDEMVYRAVSGSVLQFQGMRIDRATSISGTCVELGRLLYCEDSETDARVDRDACRKVGLRSMLVAPLFHEGETVGVLKVLSASPSAFGPAAGRILSYMTELIAAAMFNAARYSQQELFVRATRDSLTGLCNRALFEDRLQHAADQSKRLRQRFAVIAVDVDGLKALNDQHGHAIGDFALRTQASRLAVMVRQSDTVARVGGDEFALVISPVVDRAAAAGVVRKLRAALREPFTHAGATYSVGASVGLALFPDDSESTGTLREIADKAMYEEKRANKARSG